MANELKGSIAQEIQSLEEVLNGLGVLFGRESSTIDGEHLMLDNLSRCLDFVVSHHARATVLLGRVRSICAKGEARLKVGRTKAYIDIRSNRRDKSDADAAAIKSPSQKDAEVMAQGDTSGLQLELADWEGLKARIDGVAGALEKYCDIIKTRAWLLRKDPV